MSELLVALGSGGALVLAPAPELLPGPGLAGQVAAQGVTHLTLPPAVLAVLAEADLAPVRRWCQRGGAERRLADRCRRGGLVNAYGPTETTVVRHHDRCRCRPGPAGRSARPVAGSQAFVLDAWLEPVPARVAGELYVAGAALARGYWAGAGADGRAVRGVPVRPAGSADVPDRGPGPVDSAGGRGGGRGAAGVRRAGR